MNKHELFQIAFNTIHHKKLRNFGIAGHVACALETINSNIFTGICIDLPCSIGLCAEQSAIAEMKEVLLKDLLPERWDNKWS